jgi:hypothetical protein
MTLWLLKWHAFVSLRQISQAGLLKWHAFVSLRPISETGLSKWHTFVSPRQISEGGLLQQNVFSSFRHHLIFHAGPLEVAYFCNPQIDLRGRFVTTDCIFTMYVSMLRQSHLISVRTRRCVGVLCLTLSLVWDIRCCLKLENTVCCNKPPSEIYLGLTKACHFQGSCMEDQMLSEARKYSLL